MRTSSSSVRKMTSSSLRSQSGSQIRRWYTHSPIFPRPQAEPEPLQTISRRVTVQSVDAAVGACQQTDARHESDHVGDALDLLFVLRVQLAPNLIGDPSLLRKSKSPSATARAADGSPRVLMTALDGAVALGRGRQPFRRSGLRGSPRRVGLPPQQATVERSDLSPGRLLRLACAVRADDEHRVTVERTLRPLRVGYRLDPRSRAQIQSAVETATMHWGGAFHALIPSFRSRPPW